MAYFKQVIELPDLHRIEVTSSQITVERMVSDEEPVVPDIEDDVEDVDPLFILTNIQKKHGLDELDFMPDRNPYISLYRAAQKISEKKLRPSYIVAPAGEWLSAFLGLEEGEEPRTTFGLKVIYTTSDAFADKILVLGGPTNLLTDVTYGVAIDMGA